MRFILLRRKLLPAAQLFFVAQRPFLRSTRSSAQQKAWCFSLMCHETFPCCQSFVRKKCSQMPLMRDFAHKVSAKLSHLPCQTQEVEHSPSGGREGTASWEPCRSHGVQGAGDHLLCTATATRHADLDSPQLLLCCDSFTSCCQATG